MEEQEKRSDLIICAGTRPAIGPGVDTSQPCSSLFSVFPPHACPCRASWTILMGLTSDIVTLEITCRRIKILTAEMSQIAGKTDKYVLYQRGVAARKQE